jgi:hypothetical protein
MSRSSRFQVLDHGSGDATLAMAVGDGKVVEVDLGAGLLELRQHVRGKAADDFRSVERGNGDEVVAGEQRAEVGVGRNQAGSTGWETKIAVDAGRCEPRFGFESIRIQQGDEDSCGVRTADRHLLLRETLIA